MIGLTKTLVCAINDRIQSEHGKRSGLADEALLDSILASPASLQQAENLGDDLAQHAARLAVGLTHNRPFVDGNQRTAHVCYRVFIALNDGELIATDEEKYATMIGLSNGVMTH